MDLLLNRRRMLLNAEKEEYILFADPIPAEYPFMKGELGRWKGHIYESNIDNNVWTPDAYPAGWTLRE